MKPTIANLRKLAERHGGVVESDGCGGYDILADPDAKYRWIDGEVWCLPLPLNEIDPADHRAEIQWAMDNIIAPELFND
jgi:hypothetical protein